MKQTARAEHEIKHGQMLARNDSDALWGWGSPAGAERARRRGQLVSEAAGLGAGISALELGCGSGLFTQMFAQTGAQVTAVDISPELIELAKPRNPNVTFICARFEDLKFDKAFDAVVGSSVLHHLEIDAALEKCHQVLKPGGVMAFAEPNFLNPQIFAERTFMRRFLPQVSPDETAFVRWTLAACLRRHGFGAIRIVPFDWLHPAIPKPLIKLVQSAGSMLEKIPVIREFSGSLLIVCRKA